MAQIVSLSWLFTSTLAPPPNPPTTLHPLLPSLSEGYFPRMEAGRWKNTDQECIVTFKAQRKHRLLKHSWNLPGWALCVNTTTFFIPGFYLGSRMCYRPRQRSFNQLEHKHASKTWNIQVLQDICRISPCSLCVSYLRAAHPHMAPLMESTTGMRRIAVALCLSLRSYARWGDHSVSN